MSYYLPARSVFGFGVLPAPNPPRLVAFPTSPSFFAFGFWVFSRPKSPQVGCIPNPPRVLCFRFLRFYSPQIPPGCFPSQPTPPPPALSLLSVFEVLLAPNPPRLFAFPTPLLSLLSVLGFYPPHQIPPGWLPSHPPSPRFLCFRFLGFYPPQIPQGWLPSQLPRALFAFGFWVLPAPNLPKLVAFPTPRAFSAFGFWGFTNPQPPQVGCLPNSTLFLRFPDLGFYPPQTHRSLFFQTTHAIFAFRLLPSLITISTFLHFTNRCGPIGKSCYR